MGGNGGGAKVNGQPVKPRFIITRCNVEDTVHRVLMAFVQRDGAGPFAFAQNRLKFAQHRHSRGDVVDIPLFFQGRAQAFQISRRRVHVGFCNFDIIGANGWIHDHDAG